MRAEDLAKKIKMLVCDVDGVFTDGGLYYDDQGRIVKRFHVQDGFGVKLAQAAGLKIAVITGLESEAVRKRFTELGVFEYHAGNREKEKTISQICADNSLSVDEVAFLGDDWVDASAMRVVGLPLAVCNAQPEIKQMAVWVSSMSGGNGAVREAIRFILLAQGKLEKFWLKWLG